MRALRRAGAERLEDHMVPQRVVIHAELPRTGNKVDRRALVASAEQAAAPAAGARGA